MGKLSTKVEPRPGKDRTLTLAWVARHRCLTMERPRPVPPAARERPMSTR